MAKIEKLTPLMQQYFDIREEYPDSILFFQVGDFYELFFEDAKRASAFLAIALTKRGKKDGADIPLCGVPIHALNHYLVKMIRGGFKVAIADQLEKPQPGTVVKRGVTRVFTPGTLTDEQMLDEKSASYLLSFFPGKERWGLVFTELLTAQVFATSVPAGAHRMVETELIRFFPDEIIIPQERKVQIFDGYFRKLGYPVSIASEKGDAIAEKDSSAIWAEERFEASTLQQLQKMPDIEQSLYLLYRYLKKNQQEALSQFQQIQFYQPEDYLILDAATQKNLEIVKNLQDGTRKNSLFSVMDRSVTAMGSRTIKKWLQRPLIQKKSILHRQEFVKIVSRSVSGLQQLEESLSQISDLERIVGRISLGRAQLHDYRALKGSLKVLQNVKTILQREVFCPLSMAIQGKMKDFTSLIQLLDASINEDPSNSWTIREGFDLELDRLRSLVQGSQQAVLQLERKEVERTGIQSLKIRFNQVSGYYIEVTNPNLSRVPVDYIQQNKLVNRVRFVTQELKDLERDILKAQNEIEVVESTVYERVKRETLGYLSDLRQLAQSVAYLDGLLGFSRLAYDNAYVVPEFNEKRAIEIEKGRHPVIEQKIDNFEPNDTKLTDTESLWVLTGPNMGGKSTYLRQVALISIMAQCGSLVPASVANLPILDRIFTRIGSGDNLAEGKSTFLVEMEETASICSQATKNSLIILDEVGRGTSTFDGMALAQAIIEYIVKEIGARALFATHYHELTKLKDHFKNIKNYHVDCRRAGQGLLFLHKVEPGESKGSFGLDVAKLAQLPPAVVNRAAVILKALEEGEAKTETVLFEDNSSDRASDAQVGRLKQQLAYLKAETEQSRKLNRAIKDISFDDLSPKKAFDLLWELKEKV
jgi:DNA mismatch repair protein MutS